MKILIEVRRIGELLFVESKDLKLVHIIDVHPDYITRDLLQPESIGNLFDTAIWEIGEAALLKSKCPQGRKRHFPDQLSKRSHHLLRRAPFYDENPERISF